MQWHPYAKLFPMLPEVELQALADDIAKNGQRHPIIVDPKDRIIDGRNRAAACELAQVKPKTTVFDGSDREVLDYVLSLNLLRRHLSESQRAMVAAELANLEAHRPKNKSANLQSSDPPVTQPEAAKLLNVSTRSVADAKKVQKSGTPELQQAVKQGEVSVSKAAKIAELPKPKQAAAITQGIPKPVKRYPQSDAFNDWLESVRMRTDGILQQHGSLSTLMDCDGWDHGFDGVLHPKLAGLKETLTQFEKEMAAWRAAHGQEI